MLLYVCIVCPKSMFLSSHVQRQCCKYIFPRQNTICVINKIYIFFVSYWNVSADGPGPIPSDVSILVTKPSPETPAAPPPATASSSLSLRQDNSTLVHVLVHRESDEYKDEDLSPSSGGTFIQLI